MKIFHGGKKIAFTLIELLVTVAVIAILMSLLLPSLQKAKDAGRSVVCLNNQKQCAIAQLSYMSDFQGYGIIYSGWNDWTWSEYLYRTNYITAQNFLVCPSWAPFKYTTKYNTYGMLMWVPNTAFFISAVTSSGNHTFASTKVSSPSDYFLFVDSFSTTTNTASLKYQKQVCDTGINYTTTARMHTRHNNKANIAFLDGHAATCDQSAIISSARKTNGDSSSVTIVNKNLIEVPIYP